MKQPLWRITLLLYLIQQTSGFSCMEVLPEATGKILVVIPAVAKNWCKSMYVSNTKNLSMVLHCRALTLLSCVLSQSRGQTNGNKTKNKNIPTQFCLLLSFEVTHEAHLSVQPHIIQLTQPVHQVPLSKTSNRIRNREHFVRKDMLFRSYALNIFTQGLD